VVLNDALSNGGVKSKIKNFAHASYIVTTLDILMDALLKEKKKLM
jgi:hypothetical protein